MSIPLPSHWQRNALPLSYTRLLLGSEGWDRTTVESFKDSRPTIERLRIELGRDCEAASLALERPMRSVLVSIPSQWALAQAVYTSSR